MDIKPENVIKVPNNSTSPQIKSVEPTQKSAKDTSNWDSKVLTAPNGRLIIETKQNEALNRVVISE